MTTALEGVSGQQQAPAALCPRERPGTHCTGGWVGPRAGLESGKSCPHRNSIPDRPARSSVAIPTEILDTQQKWVPGTFPGGKGCRCVRLTTYHHPVPLSWNLGTLTSWNPLGYSRPVMGLLYLYFSQTAEVLILEAVKSWPRPNGLTLLDQMWFLIVLEKVAGIRWYRYSSFLQHFLRKGKLPPLERNIVRAENSVKTTSRVRNSVFAENCFYVMNQTEYLKPHYLLMIWTDSTEQWRTEGGCSNPPSHRISEGPPKSCQTQPDCENS